MQKSEKQIFLFLILYILWCCDNPNCKEIFETNNYIKKIQNLSEQNEVL